MNDTPPDAGRNTRPSLLVRLRDGADADAWRTFVDVYAPLLYTFARGRGLQDADAADVGQEVLADVARCIRTFEYQPDKGRFRDWLGLIARRKLGKFLTKREGQPGILGEETPGEVDPEWSSAFHTRLLEVGLERIQSEFEATTWQAFNENWIQNRTVTEVASSTGLSVAAVYVAKSRVLKRLREVILEIAEDVPQFA